MNIVQRATPIISLSAFFLHHSGNSLDAAWFFHSSFVTVRTFYVCKFNMKLNFIWQHFGALHMWFIVRFHLMFCSLVSCWFHVCNFLLNFLVGFFLSFLVDFSTQINVYFCLVFVHLVIYVSHLSHDFNVFLLDFCYISSKTESLKAQRVYPK